MQPITVYTRDAATNGVQISPPIMCDPWCPGYVGVQVNIYGNAKYTVQATLDDPNSPTSPVPFDQVTWFPCGDPNLVNSEVPAQYHYVAAPRFIRLVQTDGSGIAMMTVAQNGFV